MVKTEKLKNSGGVGWWVEYESLQIRYGLTEDQESASRREWKSTALKRSMCKTACSGGKRLKAEV